MFNVLKTLMNGASARADEALTDHFAIDLIEQKIREAEASLGAAKNTLASLIIRQRNEERHVTKLDVDIKDLETRAGLALSNGNEDLAAEAATAIADLINEREVRKATVDQVAQRVIRTQGAVAKANRRIIDLRQGMISARAADAERKAQKSLNRSIGSSTAIRDAEALINRVLNQDDPLEQSNVLDEIDASLDGKSVRDRLAEAGYGDRTKVSAADVLSRLKAANAPTTTD
jgi:phage shock protein A